MGAVVGFYSPPQSKRSRASAGQLDLTHPARRLSRALKAAISAASAAQRFAKRKHFPLSFDADCVWSMAENLLETDDVDCVATDHCHANDDDFEEDERGR